MTSRGIDPLDRLFELLPAIYRQRDTEHDDELRALLRVIAEQVDVVEADIARLYDDWFIETAQDWVVPYIADLIGYEPVADVAHVERADAEAARVLVPRRDVANTIRARARKGTLALLEDLARDAAGWPGRAVEFARLLAYAQNPDFLRPTRGLSTSVRDPEVLERLDGPFDVLAHSVDVRRILSPVSRGRHNVPSVGLYLWRLRAYPVTRSPAASLEAVAPNAYTFSVLGNDAPLFAKPRPEVDEAHIAQEHDLPLAIRRRALEKQLAAQLAAPAADLRAYGVNGSFMIWRGVKQRGKIKREPVPAEQVVVADLSDWRAYRPRRNTVAVDPVLGRMAFPFRQLPAGVWVSYHYGFSADLGGGEYPRGPAPAPARETFHCRVAKAVDGPRAPTEEPRAESIAAALALWDEVRHERPEADLEILDSEVYSEQLSIALYQGEHVTIRAADGRRPVVYLLDRERNQPDALTLYSEALPAAEEQPVREAGGTVTLDGLLIAGRAVHVEGPLECVTIRHCTLVPGWGLEGPCRPLRPSEPSLELYQTTARVRVERSILGSIMVYQDEVASDPVRVSVCDSIVDATDDGLEAVYSATEGFAHALLELARCTVIGGIAVHALDLVQDCLLLGQVHVARRQVGCLRFSYVPAGSRTPRRYRCQPDLAEAALRASAAWKALSPAQRATALEHERLRVKPVLDSTRYGTPTYARLAASTAAEIRRGAESESEMGAFHLLYAPQRLANLAARLEEYTPARTDAAYVLAD
jgi:hypothetical protein